MPKTPTVPIDKYTLSYNPNSTGKVTGQVVGGWPSFYSYFPDFMIGMNSFFYSFKGGNLWRHNTNETRNNYYGINYKSTITSVFNPEPSLSIKLFKTMSYESTTTVADTTQSAWSCSSLNTDLTDGSPGSMLETYFVQKEGEWFSFLRTKSGTVNWKARSANGIGACTTVSPQAGGFTILSFIVSTGSIISIGDFIFAATLVNGTVQGTPILAGTVSSVSDNSISVIDTVPPAIPTPGQYIMYLKDSQAESHGARGYYLQFKLENTSTDPVELFAVGSSVMKSNP